MFGGVPLPDGLVMCWNFVGRSRDETAGAWQDWRAGDERFGTVDSPLSRLPANPPAWLRREGPAD